MGCAYSRLLLEADMRGSGMIVYHVYFRHGSEGNIGLGLELEMDCVSVGEEVDIYEVIVVDEKRYALEQQLNAAENVLYYEVPAERDDIAYL